MAESKKSDADPIVRVRGGRKGVRFIKLSEWKKEQSDKKRKPR